jgi:transcriptional regulator with XRE-family HTH domain
VSPQWSQEPFETEVPRLLEERGLSLRALARQVGVDHGYLSRAIRGTGKVPSLKLAVEVAAALDLPSDYFVEVREQFVIDRVREDSALRERLYRRLSSPSR